MKQHDLWHIIHKDVTASTSDDCRALAHQGAATGTVVVAREQRAGKGQWNRSWASPRGGLYLSCLLRPDVEQAQWSQLSLLVAQAVKRGIERACSIDPHVLRIKEPNDVVCDAGKISGILLESFGGTTIVVGCGVNVAHPVHDIETDGRNVPAYVQDYAPEVNGTEECLDQFLSCILEEIEQLCYKYLYNET